MIEKAANHVRCLPYPRLCDLVQIARTVKRTGQEAMLVHFGVTTLGGVSCVLRDHHAVETMLEVEAEVETNDAVANLEAVLGSFGARMTHELGFLVRVVSAHRSPGGG